MRILIIGVAAAELGAKDLPQVIGMELLPNTPAVESAHRLEVAKVQTPIAHSKQLPSCSAAKAKNKPCAIEYRSLEVAVWT